ncbi:MAG: hypothetical protein FWF28_11145 [Micrococcales bacterium]|nr:hypothetical protein [Micrococcales bacterium]
MPSSSEPDLFAEVLRLTDRGLRVARVASQLQVSDEVVGLVLEHAERLGLVMRPNAAPCGTGSAPCAPGLDAATCRPGASPSRSGGSSGGPGASPHRPGAWPARTGCPTGPDRPLACAGCPFAR